MASVKTLRAFSYGIIERCTCYLLILSHESERKLKMHTDIHTFTYVHIFIRTRRQIFIRLCGYIITISHRLKLMENTYLRTRKLTIYNV